MKKLMLLLLVSLFTSFTYGQTILDKIKAQAIENGLKHIHDVEFELQEDGLGSSFITLAPGDYKIFGMGGFSEVKDIDLFIYNYNTDELIAKENTEIDGITILNITLEEATRVWIKVYNRKSSPELEYYECYLLITKF
ncbi:MAG: hypothetical protein OQJ83_07335 [Altibacter sp.]|uniref:hypothetical protein n=1 Tax=Altibacter lentus TaxID=1223410 RepID=UPI00054DCBB1|nr:hypothetical protein [Altibacter lentus]MCW8981184.1 hypothetical protein [Altibacter sp.]